MRSLPDEKKDERKLQEILTRTAMDHVDASVP
jgi:hypothetical protein